MLIAATLLILIHLHGASTQGQGECSSVEMRRATVDKKLAALGCDNYTCGMLIAISLNTNYYDAASV